MCAKMKKYPEIKTINVSYETQMAGNKKWIDSFCSEHEINNGHIPCRNKLCQSGGVYFSQIIHDMVKDRQEENEPELLICHGRDNKGGCPNQFKIKIKIEYGE